MDIYRELILDHYKHPRNYGHLDSADAKAEEHNTSCGDRIVMEVLFSDDDSNTTIKDIRFSGEGCAISQASASMLTEEIKGKTPEQIFQLKTENIIQMIGTVLTPTRIKCAVLPLEVLQKALKVALLT
jgi:nitrogen fixation NifU-like protein